MRRKGVSRMVDEERSMNLDASVASHFVRFRSMDDASWLFCESLDIASSNSSALFW
jgi:hypothetical protein